MSAEPSPIEKAHYGKLVGRRIIGIHWEDFEGDPLPFLLLRCGRKNTFLVPPAP